MPLAVQVTLGFSTTTKLWLSVLVDQQPIDLNYATFCKVDTYLILSTVAVKCKKVAVNLCRVIAVLIISIVPSVTVSNL